MKRSKKLKNRLAKRVLSGRITVDEARRKLGRDITQKSAAAALAKAQSAHAGLTSEAVRQAIFAGFRSARPVTEQDVLDAAQPLTRPPVTKAAVPVRRETPAQALAILKSAALAPPAPLRLVRSWTPAELAMLREADNMTDPGAREALKASLYADRERMT
jgi:hypothetical protein